MQRDRLSRMRDGWWIGDFYPSCSRQRGFEVAYKQHRKGQRWPAHYQKRAVEYNLLIHGRMKLNGILFKKGDIFILHPKEVARPIFLTHCEVMVVKVPSLPADKVLVR